ncbi:MAG: metal-dependent hydrolase [Methanomicrobiales archaeon]|nr:metal-dependent hydrolase [Methanomicrobiales archaeon]
MYFFFHLVTGVIIGLLLGDMLRDHRWVIPCAAGAILPDLIDKPVGFILFGATIDNGRIWFHSLLICALVFGIGVVVWEYRRSPLGVAAAVGIFSHQVLDLMWRQPVTWFYPLLGPFREKYPAGHLFALLLQELTNPWEWMLMGLVALGLVLYVNRERVVKDVQNYPRAVRACLMIIILVLGLLSIALFIIGLVDTHLFLFDWTRPEEYIIGSIVIGLGAYLLWRWRLFVTSGYPYT